MALTKNLTFAILGEDKTASKTMSGFQKVAETVGSRVGGVFTNLGSQLGGEFGEILSRVGEGISTVGEHAGKMTAVLGAGGGVVTGLGVAMQQMGSADKQATDQLKQSISASGNSYEEYREEIEKTIQKQEGFGHGAADTQQALARMTSALGSPKKALEQMGLVANLAASQHIHLVDAANLVDKIVGGQGSRTLSQYGVIMGKSKDKTKDAQVALEQLSGKLSGQAAASVTNFGGQVNVVKTRLTDWAAVVGQKVGPALTTIGPILMAASAAMEIGKTVMAAFKAGQIAQTAVTEGATVAQRGFNLSMLANPIMLVIVAIIALVAGLVWFFTQTKLGQAIWHNFTQFLASSWNWLWHSVLHPVITAIGVALNWLWTSVVMPVVNFIVAYTRTLGAIFNWLWNSVIRPVALWIGNAIRVVGTVIHSVFSGIGSAIQGAFSGAVSFVRGAINGIIDVINGAIGGINLLIKGVNSVPGVHVPLLGQIPHLALGGVVSRPTVALIGESGPEAVVPLHSGGRYGATQGGGVTVQVTVQAGAVGNEQYLTDTITTAMINTFRRGGTGLADLKRVLGIV